MKKIIENSKKECIVTLLFDSGKIGDWLYGEKIFAYLIGENELVKNGKKIIISVGDVLQNEIYNDIMPFIIDDSLCTIEKKEYSCKNRIYAVMMEDITIETAQKIDKRIKEECLGYLGMTSIDIDSTDDRKQFWKGLLRTYSIEAETLTFFGYEEEGFPYVETAKQRGFKINYDGFPPEEYCDNQEMLFSTRQSSFITKLDQLVVKKGKNDSDRGIMEMNFALVKEVEIAGVQIWKAIEDINRVYIPKNDNYMIVDYLFMSLYQTAQGIERLLKVIIELIVYNKSCDRNKIDELLMSHNHVGMCEFLENEGRIKLGTNERKLLELISKFYNEGRYNRFKYSQNDLIELVLFREFGKEFVNEIDFEEKVKHKYGKTIGKISRKLYSVINKLSHELNIFVYELNGESVARFVLNSYYNEDLYSLLKQIENSKRELIWYVIKKGGDLPIFAFGKDFEALSFEDIGVQECFEELIKNNNAGSLIYDYVSYEYDEQVAEDKDKWKERISFIECIGNTDVYFYEEDLDEEEE